MLDERGLKSIRAFATCMLIALTGITLILTFRHMGYHTELLNGVTIEETASFFSFSIIIISIAAIANRPKIVDAETLEIIRIKSRWTIIGVILYGAYIIFTIVVVNNIYFIICSLVMMAIYINIVMISKSLYSYTLTNRQRMWREAVNSTNYRVQDSSLFWRFKIWIRPLERVPFSDRYIGIGNIITCIFFFIFFLETENRNLFNIIFLFLFIRSIFVIIEYILGLYTSIGGICTGVKGFEEDRHRNRGSGGITITFGNRRYYWKVYVTDFENKREIVYKTYRCPFLSEGDEVKVIHGILSKSVVSANGININK